MYGLNDVYPDSKVHVAYMGPIWVLPASGGPHVGPMNLAIRVDSHECDSSVTYILHDTRDVANSVEYCRATHPNAHLNYDKEMYRSIFFVVVNRQIISWKFWGETMGEELTGYIKRDDNIVLSRNNYVLIETNPIISYKATDKHNNSTLFHQYRISCLYYEKRAILRQWSLWRHYDSICKM